MSASVNGARSAADNTSDNTTRTRKVRAAWAADRIAQLTQDRIHLEFPGKGATALERVAYWERRALLAAQLAGWWHILGLTSIAEVPEVFIDAALGSWQTERANARSDRERARTWTEIHTRRSTKASGVPR